MSSPRKSFEIESQSLVTYVIPIFENNYVFVGRKKSSKDVFIVDPGSAPEILELIQSKDLNPILLFLTHSHADHIDGAKEILAEFPQCEILASSSAKEYLQMKPGRILDQEASFSELSFQVLQGPGHTWDHIAIYFEDEQSLFSGDILFGFGCGRIFNGSLEEHFQTMQKIKDLPDSTKVFCAHEYSQRNLEFIMQKLQDLPPLIKSQYSPAILAEMQEYLTTRFSKTGSSIPLDLQFEKKFNPFLKVQGFSDFKALRQLRNQF